MSVLGSSAFIRFKGFINRWNIAVSLGYVNNNN